MNKINHQEKNLWNSTGLKEHNVKLICRQTVIRHHLQGPRNPLIMTPIIFSLKRASSSNLNPHHMCAASTICLARVICDFGCHCFGNLWKLPSASVLSLSRPSTSIVCEIMMCFCEIPESILQLVGVNKSLFASVTSSFMANHSAV